MRIYYKIPIAEVAMFLSAVTGSIAGYYANDIFKLLGVIPPSESRRMDAEIGGLSGLISGILVASTLESKRRINQ
ncbi:hypothetical protein HYX08_06030 [Candidatus Woesearchaeota archaeon]|nr:hypothetical protein [Candidatus Woesearchaeota archaeon]